MCEDITAICEDITEICEDITAICEDITEVKITNSKGSDKHDGKPYSSRHEVRPHTGLCGRKETATGGGALFPLTL
jgi:hypothetical protein